MYLYSLVFARLISGKNIYLHRLSINLNFDSRDILIVLRYIFTNAHLD